MEATLKHSLEVAKQLELVFTTHEYHVGIAGGVLYKDGIRKDIDLIIYSHTPKNHVTESKVIPVLISMGFEISKITDVRYTERNIIITSYKGTRIDFFLLN